MNNYQQKANKFFLGILSVGLLFLAAIIVAGVGLFPAVKSVWAAIFSRLEEICGCANHFNFYNHPVIFSLIIFFGLGLAVFLFISAVKIFKFRRKTSRFIKSNIGRRKKELPLKILTISRELGIDDKIILVRSKKLIVFCYGWLRPKICLSSELANKLSRTQLRAVLDHEKSHLLAYEPFKVFTVKIIKNILFFLPSLGRLADQYFTFSELSADEHATKNFTDRLPLAQALYKIVMHEEKSLRQRGVALSFFSNVVGERINKLADSNYSYGAKINFYPTLIKSLLILGAVFSIFYGLIFFSNRSLAAEHDINSCPLYEAGINHKCEMELQEAECTMSYGLEAGICEEKI